MKGRFLLFAGDEFYAQGGWHDFVHAFPTRDEAVATGKGIFNGLGDVRYPNVMVIDWWHVVDVDLNRIVAHSDRQAHGAGDGFDANGETEIGL